MAIFQQPLKYEMSHFQIKRNEGACYMKMLQKYIIFILNNRDWNWATVSIIHGMVIGAAKREKKRQHHGVW